MSTQADAIGDATPAGPGPATFEGKISLANFVFKSETTLADRPVRRSTRLQAQIGTGLTIVGVPSTSPQPNAAPGSGSTPHTLPAGVSASVPGSSSRASSHSASTSGPGATRRTPSDGPAGSNSSATRRTTLSRASATSSPRPAKRQRQKTGYAPPSTYAHLPLLPDAIGPDLLVLFVGLNPGVQTATCGHAYAHPSNLFWKLLHSSGVTPRFCSFEEDGQMPRLFSLGLTNIVARPSRNGSELSKAEMDAGVAILEEKARRHRPESMCIVGKSIWESFWRVRYGRAIAKAEFKYGWQDASENFGSIAAKDGQEGWAGARIFVATSTSGLAASLSMAEKERIWRQLGEWVERRREERKAVGAA